MFLLRSLKLVVTFAAPLADGNGDVSLGAVGRVGRNTFKLRVNLLYAKAEEPSSCV